ncbi:hypothetical protein CJ178_31990 [Rhodococcus sp. ACPA4]|uniref:HutD/Ves family protein n=1 Tax=Rhodococcus sp. ACPA4 TaxID=2028571 RepID=UPI000BB142AD|nr:HutD family protein [Rhodococcus sp. ACPA4]PBC36037.1 hypothetical protein CJ178_31990 [Rhodococcus sp. ACPA4]
MPDLIVPLRREDRLRTPWKNGAGTTEEVAVDGGAHPGWRISIADLGDTPSIFSTFPGLDRIFTIVGPHGVDLELAGTTSHVAPLRPFTFDGEVDLRCVPAGSTSAFNVMVDRNSYRAAVTIHDLRDTALHTDPDTVTVAYVHSGRIDAEGHTAHSGDCLLVRRSAVEMVGIGTITRVEITALRS